MVEVSGGAVGTAEDTVPLVYMLPFSARPNNRMGNKKHINYLEWQDETSVPSICLMLRETKRSVSGFSRHEPLE